MVICLHFSPTWFSLTSIGIQDSDRKQNHCNISAAVLFHCLLCLRIHSSVLGHPSNMPPDPAHP